MKLQNIYVPVEKTPTSEVIEEQKAIVKENGDSAKYYSIKDDGSYSTPFIVYGRFVDKSTEDIGAFFNKDVKIFKSPQSFFSKQPKKNDIIEIVNKYIVIDIRESEYADENASYNYTFVVANLSKNINK